MTVFPLCRTFDFLSNDDAHSDVLESLLMIMNEAGPWDDIPDAAKVMSAVLQRVCGRFL